MTRIFAVLANELKSSRKKKPTDALNPAVQRDVREYCTAHPDSPAAVRQPHIVVDRGRYVALLGRSPKHDVFGFGSSVSSALRAFDELYTRSKLKR